MNMKEYLEVKTLIHERSVLHINDPRISDYWTQIVEVLENDEQIMIEVLNKCTETEIYWLCEIFDDIAFKFPTTKYINTLLEIQKKYPEIDMTVDIEFAKKALE